jgi:hypothetical protein
MLEFLIDSISVELGGYIFNKSLASLWEQSGLLSSIFSLLKKISERFSIFFHGNNWYLVYNHIYFFVDKNESLADIMEKKIRSVGEQARPTVQS